MSREFLVGKQIDARDLPYEWTTAEFYRAGSITYLFLLEERRGIVHVHKMNTDGTVGNQIKSYDWNGGWTTAKFYTVGDATYLFLLKESDGSVHINKITSGGTVGDKIKTYDWNGRWTTAEFYTIEGVTYLFLLKESDGSVHINKITSGGTVGDKIKTYDWNSGWTTAKFYTVGDATYLFLLRASDGCAQIHKMNTDGTVGDKIKTYDWNSGWTTAEFYTIEGVTYLFLLKKSSGIVHINKMTSGGTVGDKIKTYDWNGRWTTAKFCTIGGISYLLSLEESNGIVHVHEISKVNNPPVLTLTASVGQGGTNKADDILALKKALIDLGMNWLTKDSVMNNDTLNAIKLFQSIIHGNNTLQGDGRVDVPGPTYDWLRASNAPCWQLMPASGDGFTNFERLQQPNDHHDFGTDWMATTIQSLGCEYEYAFHSSHPTSALISVNDVSLPRGGDTPDHKGHETGLACDIQLPNKNGTSGGISWSNTASYDRDVMRVMLTVIKNHPLWNRTFFNDSILIQEGLCSWQDGHDDHAHFEIIPPERVD